MDDGSTRREINRILSILGTLDFQDLEDAIKCVLRELKNDQDSMMSLIKNTLFQLQEQGRTQEAFNVFTKAVDANIFTDNEAQYHALAFIDTAIKTDPQYALTLVQQFGGTLDQLAAEQRKNDALWEIFNQSNDDPAAWNAFLNQHNRLHTLRTIEEES